MCKNRLKLRVVLVQSYELLQKKSFDTDMGNPAIIWAVS